MTVPFPTQPLTTSFRCVPLGELHPRLGLQPHPCFLARGVGCSSAAPSTHQDQGSLTSRWPAKRLPLAPVVPQKTVGSLPCPIGYCVQMPWLPEGSRFPMAHGRGVARPHNPVGGPLTWVEAERIKRDGCQPFFLPVSHLNPTGGSTSAKSFMDIKGPQVAHDVIARPRQFMGDRLPGDHQMAFRRFPLVKPLHRRAETEGKLGRFHVGPRQIRVAIFDVALAFPFPIAEFDTLDTATVRGIVTHRWKA